MSKGYSSSYRIALLAGGLFVCFAGLGVRLVWLHTVDREAWLLSVARKRHTTVIEKAQRGDILDRNGKVLATSRSFVVLAVDPSCLLGTDKEKQKWPKLAALLKMPEPELNRIFTTKLRAAAPAAPALAAPSASKPAGLVFNLIAPVAPETNAAAADEDGDADFTTELDANGRRVIKWAKLAENVSEETMLEVRKLDLRGLCPPERRYRRVYPNNQLAAHLIGYVNGQEKPTSGVEFYTDFYLRGQNGWRVSEVDGRNRELPQFGSREVPAADGYSVMLSIDRSVQDIIEQELTAIARKFEPLKATIIVSDPRTGFILGMANYPTFNLNEYNQVPKEEEARMKNVAVADVYEPGSVFKIVAVSAALEERLVSPQTAFDCMMEKIEYKGRKTEYTGRMLKLPRDDHHYDHELTVAEIITHSSNRGAAQLGMLLGEERLSRYARAYGFGKKLGFPVGGEVSGIFAKPEKWDLVDITRIPMGQSIAATALQMHQAMATIAGGGVLYRPQIIQQIRDASGEIVFRYGKVEIGRATSEATARTMATLLMGPVSKEGTAPEAAIPGFEVAGKTGTAQKYIDGKPSEHHHVASFVGFFPASRPQVAISVIVDDADAHAPGGVAYGKSVAAPSFKNIGEKLIPILDIKSTTQPARFTIAAAAEGGRR